MIAARSTTPRPRGMIEARAARPRSRALYVARAGRALLSDPYEALERTFEKAAAWRDAHRTRGVPAAVAEAPEERLHDLIGAPWPCPEHERFAGVWEAAVEDLRARELPVGRCAFGGWDDGDRRLVGLAWCLARHLSPRRVVETGVARGLTTRALLEALELAGRGRLWSIDLAPLLERDLGGETAAAVPAHLRARWTFLRGSSRRRLPGLISELRQVDLFVHDSMHTTRNVRFEIQHVWPALAPGGALLIDDVEQNAALPEFLARHPDVPAMVCASEDEAVLIGCLVKPR